MEEEILALAMELGGIKEGEEQGLLLCCRLAREELDRKRKPEILPEDCAPIFSLAAAKIGLCDWLILRQASEPERFTAGDVTVERGKGDPSLLRRQALEQLAPYLKRNTFFFQEVRS